jgi:hypothetical protein
MLRRMDAKRMTLVCAAALFGAILPGARAHACSATETQVYQSATTVWCVDNGIIQQHGTFPTAFFAYGDNVVKELVSIFNVPAQGVYTFEAGPQTGGAHTGSECCGLGVTVTGDAFYGDAYGATGFWGYLLSLHEMINDWTGQVSSGWPTDFWADHVSAFPNSMDWHIMQTLGAQLNDANLTAAATGQKARFYPGGDSVDPRVPMFDSIFALPGMGYSGFSHIFGYVSGDKLDWDSVAQNNGANPDQRRTEYVIAYLSLGARQSLLPVMQMANVGNGHDDGQGDPTYTAQQANIDAIATAHCAIAAAKAQGKDESADLAALQAGNYGAVTAKGACGSGCPAECGCKSSTNACVAPWLGDSVASDGGVGGGGNGGGGNSDGGNGGNGGVGDGGNTAKGCSCEIAGRDVTRAGWLVLALSVPLALSRRRLRK